MTLRDALEEHLRTIEARDLEALAATVAERDLVLIMADGKLARSAREFLREPPATHGRSYLTLVFQKRQGRWRMVHDQNTPIK